MIVSIRGVEVHCKAQAKTFVLQVCLDITRLNWYKTTWDKYKETNKGFTKTDMFNRGLSSVSLPSLALFCSYLFLLKRAGKVNVMLWHKMAPKRRCFQGHVNEQDCIRRNIERTKTTNNCKQNKITHENWSSKSELTWGEDGAQKHQIVNYQK